jgi:hypothetical protein
LSARIGWKKLADMAVRAPFRKRFAASIRDFKIVKTLHEPGKAELPLGLTARQRRPTCILVNSRFSSTTGFRVGNNQCRVMVLRKNQAEEDAAIGGVDRHGNGVRRGRT